MADEETHDPHHELHLSLLQWLRATKAHALYYCDKEGKRRRVSLRNGKGRWEIAARMLMRMIDEIERLEVEDARGSMVDTWRVPDAPDPEAEREHAIAKEAEEEERATPRELKAAVFIAKMVEDARRTAVAEHTKAQRELLTFIMDGNKQTAARLEVLERSYSGMIKTVFEAYRTRAEIEGFIAGGGLKPQNQETGDPNERLMLLLLAKKFGLDPSLLGVGEGAAPQLPQGTEQQETPPAAPGPF